MVKIRLLLAILLLNFINLNAKRLVTVGGSITETVIALGHEKDLVGVDLSSVYPANVVKNIPKVGYWLQLPKEGILSLKPDLVIASESSKPKKFLKILPKYSISVHLISDKNTIKSAKDKIMQVAAALGETKKAKKIISRIDENVNFLLKQIKTIKTKPKALFILNQGVGVMMAAGKQTKVGAMIKLAGGVNVIKQNQYVTISLESILKMNPDVIIYSSHHSNEVFKKGIILETNASKNKQIYHMDMLLISGFTVRLDTALKDLACIFHKEKFSICK